MNKLKKKKKNLVVFDEVQRRAIRNEGNDWEGKEGNGVLLRR
jgi:hypothetical protein